MTLFNVLYLTYMGCKIKFNTEVKTFSHVLFVMYFILLILSNYTTFLSATVISGI